MESKIEVGLKPKTDDAELSERSLARRPSVTSPDAVACGGCLGFFAHTKREKPPFAVDKAYFLDESGLFGDKFTMDYLLHPPASITFQMGKQLAATIRKIGNHVGDCRRFNPEVFICHAVGRREHDSASTGPGVFFVAAILRLLFSYGIPCFSTLMVNEKFRQAHRGLRSLDPHALMMERLASRAYSCKVMIVIETKALYEDHKCLEQIACAIRCNNVELMRVRFEEDALIPREMQWAGVKHATGSKRLIQMREEVQGCMDESMTVQAESPEDQKLLMRVIEYVARKSERIVNWNPDPNPWREAQTRQEAWVDERVDGSFHSADDEMSEMAMEYNQTDGHGTCAGSESHAVKFLQQARITMTSYVAWTTMTTRSEKSTASMKSVRNWLQQYKPARHRGQKN